MPTPQYRIVFHNPPAPDSYYYRDEVIKVDGVHQTRPLVSTNAAEAHTFSNRDSVISFRDQYRSFYPKIKIFVEDTQHNGPLFEYDREPADTGELDTRDRLWVSPDDLESQRLGFICRPCIRPGQGKLWCISPFDIPSLEEHVDAIDTIYSKPGEDPVAFVERARHTWSSLGLPVVGTPSPLEDQRDNAELKQILNEYEQSRRPGNLRPADRR